MNEDNIKNIEKWINRTISFITLIKLIIKKRESKNDVIINYLKLQPNGKELVKRFKEEHKNFLLVRQKYWIQFNQKYPEKYKKRLDKKRIFYQKKIKKERKDNEKITKFINKINVEFQNLQKQNVENKGNQEITYQSRSILNVPGDNHCMYWSIIIGALMLEINHQENFLNRILSFVVPEQIENARTSLLNNNYANLINMRELILDYLENPIENTRIFNDNRFKRLISGLRNNIAHYMQTDTSQNWSNHMLLNSRDFHLGFWNTQEYLSSVRSNGWGTALELSAISNMLRLNFDVITDRIGEHENTIYLNHEGWIKGGHFVLSFQNLTSEIITTMQQRKQKRIFFNQETNQSHLDMSSNDSSDTSCVSEISTESEGEDYIEKVTIKLDKKYPKTPKDEEFHKHVRKTVKKRMNKMFNKARNTSDDDIFALEKYLEDLKYAESKIIDDPLKSGKMWELEQFSDLVDEEFINKEIDTMEKSRKNLIDNANELEDIYNERINIQDKTNNQQIFQKFHDMNEIYREIMVTTDSDDDISDHSSSRSSHSSSDEESMEMQ